MAGPLDDLIAEADAVVDNLVEGVKSTVEDLARERFRDQVNGFVGTVGIALLIGSLLR